ncbi:hypothetical protein N7478_000917 [Penicillium angulare]|uniref:uncharacterized protein n=1 Tax=Penicillium angulare TaxID=116970 RepID=UPI0025417BE7|nr:uncharacterized protein N7478_000917 [Penicillium angulare]KAJ5291666.1 hypothetical protein N7478_000917 [Penicillium angulare]
MRLFLIPISTRRALIYSRPLRKDIPKELSILDRATTKAAQTWAKWEEAESGWKKHLVTWGNRVQQRIPFEEWGLKSIPSLNSQQRIDEAHGTRPIELLYPGNAVRPEKIPGLLRTIATERQAFHKNKMMWSFGIAPFTAPLGLIPVVPNIPFFYLAYRGWSHWRALNGSRHLEFIVKKNLLAPISLPELEHLYAKRVSYVLDNTPIDAHPNEMVGDMEKSDERVLLKMSDAKKLATIFEAPELALEAERAIVQVSEQLQAKKDEAKAKSNETKSGEKKE